MKLLDEGYMVFAKPRVIHSIPGRLRVQVPLLKRLDKKFHKWSEILNDLIKDVNGILNVSANHVSGTVLFQYESKAIKETEILSFLSSMNRVFISQKEDVELLFEKDSETVMRCLEDWMQRSVKRKLQLDTSQRILQDDFF